MTFHCEDPVARHLQCEYPLLVVYSYSYNYRPQPYDKVKEFILTKYHLDVQRLDCHAGKTLAGLKYVDQIKTLERGVIRLLPIQSLDFVK